jgi:hypothetical protein
MKSIIIYLNAGMCLLTGIFLTIWGIHGVDNIVETCSSWVSECSCVNPMSIIPMGEMTNYQKCVNSTSCGGTLFPDKIVDWHILVTGAISVITGIAGFIVAFTIYPCRCCERTPIILIEDRL